MRAYWSGAALAVATAACGLQERTPNQSCCFYECGGDRITFFSQFFGSLAECEELAQSRCRIEFDTPEEQEVVRLEFQGGVVTEPDVGLAQTCEALFEEFVFE